MRASRPSSDHAVVMLYDGICGFCNGFVQRVLKYDTRGALRFAALQSGYAQAIIARHAELTGVDSVVWVVTSAGGAEAVFTRSDAALRVAAYLGGPWRLLLVASVVPRPIRDLFYDLFARFRYRLFGKHDQCLLPSPDVRARFVDVS